MIGTLEHLDVSTAAWLAERDPALTSLPAAIAATDAGWSLHDAQWIPGQGCRLAYRVADAYAGSSTFVAVNVDPLGWTQHEFRGDPALPGIAGAADPALVADELGPVVAEPIRLCRVAPVRYRPGARCVLRYDVLTTSGRSRYYAKVFAAPVFAEAASRATQVAAAAAPALRVNRVLATWPARLTTVSAAVPGRSASAALKDASVPTAGRVDLAYRLGGLLAGFHALRGVAVSARTAGDQVRALSELRPAADLVAPALGDRLRQLTERLDREQPPGDRPDVLIHGGFRPGQVIVDAAGHLHVLDLDGVVRGNAAQDLGSALGHLAWAAIRQPSRSADPTPMGQALVAGYQSGGHAVDPVPLVWWRAAALAQIAARRFRRLEVADWAAVPRLIDLAEHLVARRPAGASR